MIDLVDKQKKLFSYNSLFYLFLILYTVVLLFLAHKLLIWEDEAYSLNTSSADLINVIKQSYNFEGQPPAYFVILAIWRKIDSGIFFARLFSLIFIGCSAIFFYKIVRLFEAVGFSRWILVLFLLNPFTVWAALEIRLYAFVIFLSVGLIYYFIQYINGKKIAIYFFLLFSLIGIYTQYFLVIEITSLVFVFWLFKGWKPILKISLYLIPVAIVFIPNLIYVSQQIEIAQRDIISESRLIELLNVLRSPQDLILGVGLIKSVVVSRIIRILFIVAISYLIWLLFKNRNQNRKHFKQFQFIVLNIIFSVFLLIIIVSITGIGFQKKYMSFLFPFFIMLFYFFKTYTFKFRNVLFLILSFYYVFLLVLNYKKPLKSYDYKTTANYVASIEQQNETILLYTKILFPGFSYYYMGQNKVSSLPKATYDQNYYKENIYDTITLKRSLNIIGRESKSFILITGQIIAFKYPIKLNDQIIDRFIQNNYIVKIDTSFIGDIPIHTLRVRRLLPKQSSNQK